MFNFIFFGLGCFGSTVLLSILSISKRLTKVWSRVVLSDFVLSTFDLSRGKTTKSSWWLKQALNYPKKYDRQIGHKNIWNHHPVESLCSQCVIDKMRPFLLNNFHTTCKCWYMCDLKAPPLTHSCLARHTFYSKIPQGSTKNTKIVSGTTLYLVQSFIPIHLLLVNHVKTD